MENLLYFIIDKEWIGFIYENLENYLGKFILCISRGLGGEADVLSEVVKILDEELMQTYNF